MKKITALALVVLMSATSVFAASSFSGYARVRLGVQKASKDAELKFGLADKSNAFFKFFLLEDTRSSAGEGDVYGEVSAFAQIRMKGVEKAVLKNSWFNLSDPTNDDGTAEKAYGIGKLPLKYKFGFNYANLVFDKDKNFKLGISGVNPARNYATGWEVEADYGNTITGQPFITYDTAYKSFASGDHRLTGGWMPTLVLSYGHSAFSFSIDGGYSSGTKATKKDINGLAFYQINDMVVSEGVKVSGNIGFFNSFNMTHPDFADGVGQQMHLLYGAKVDADNENWFLKIGATGNAQLKGENYTDGVDTDYKNSIEASLNFGLKGDFKFNVDVWFMDNQAFTNDEPDQITYNNATDLGFVYRKADGSLLGSKDDVLHQALSARISVTPADMIDIVLRGQDVINQGIIGIDLPVHLDKAFTITPSFEYTIDTEKVFTEDGKWENSGDKNSIWEGKLQFDYKHQLFSLCAWVRFGKESEADKMYIRPYIDITSKTLVAGAQLRLRWTDGTFGNADKALSDKAHADDAFGNIFLEARINF